MQIHFYQKCPFCAMDALSSECIECSSFLKCHSLIVRAHFLHISFSTMRCLDCSYLSLGCGASQHQTYNYNYPRDCLRMQTQTNGKPFQHPLQARHRNVLLKEQDHSKRKPPSRSKQSTANLKKMAKKKEKKLKQEPSFTDLFNSARELVFRNKLASEKSIKVREKKTVLGNSNNQFEESTASREFKLKTKQYDNPNGQYFGSKISIKYRKKSRSKKKERDKQVLNLTKSLELKVRSLRRMESVHSSESQSMKSDISQKEMRRLEKMHSLERMRLMEEIIGIEERIIQRKKHRV